MSLKIIAVILFWILIKFNFNYKLKKNNLKLIKISNKSVYLLRKTKNHLKWQFKIFYSIKLILFQIKIKIS